MAGLQLRGVRKSQAGPQTVLTGAENVRVSPFPGGTLMPLVLGPTLRAGGSYSRSQGQWAADGIGWVHLGKARGPGSTRSSCFFL